jgi:hypothetical protein
MTTEIVSTVPAVLELQLLRLAASHIWDEEDFVIGWYFSIWIRMCTNEQAPGYLAVDRAELYRAAGARSPEYFEKHGARMLEQHFRRDEMGRLYSPRLLQELKDSRIPPDSETRDVVVTDVSSWGR